jgi:hypothetical protein
VDALIRAPRTNKTLIGANEWLSLREITVILGEVLGKSVQFVEKNPEMNFGDPERTQDNLEMIGFCAEFGYDGGKVDKNIVQPTELGVSLSLASVREWCRKPDWAQFLEIAE